MGIPQNWLPAVDIGPSEEPQGAQLLSWSFLPYLFSFLFICVVQGPQRTDQRGHFSQVTLLFLSQEGRQLIPFGTGLPCLPQVPTLTSTSVCLWGHWQLTESRAGAPEGGQVLPTSLPPLLLLILPSPLLLFLYLMPSP